MALYFSIFRNYLNVQVNISYMKIAIDTFKGISENEIGHQGTPYDLFHPILDSSNVNSQICKPQNNICLPMSDRSQLDKAHRI